MSGYKVDIEPHTDPKVRLYSNQKFYCVTKVTFYGTGSTKTLMFTRRSNGNLAQSSYTTTFDSVELKVNLCMEWRRVGQVLNKHYLNTRPSIFT